ncbi:MAG: SDR family oxidoreductase [Cyclobacteriaceae bacterium]|nr:SDR family oxidoreductase [Cyclobacteriaceae bacterium]
MKNRFKDQVAVVTGAARGIGEAIAKRLAEEGASVAVTDINETGLGNLVGEIQEKGGTAWPYPLDITDESAVKESLDHIYQRHDRLDLLVNCAGIVGPTGIKIQDYPLAEFQQVCAVNLTGAFIVTQSALPLMLKRNYGRILHLTSIGGKEGNPNMVGYAASKSGLMGLVKGVGKEYAQTGITINGLAPAVIATKMNLDTDPQVLQYMTDKIPMKRLGTVEEAAAISCWLVSEEASFNTAAIFDLSGGRATF